MKHRRGQRRLTPAEIRFRCSQLRAARYRALRDHGMECRAAARVSKGHTGFRDALLAHGGDPELYPALCRNGRTWGRMSPPYWCYAGRSATCSSSGRGEGNTAGVSAITTRPGRGLIFCAGQAISKCADELRSATLTRD